MGDMEIRDVRSLSCLEYITLIIPQALDLLSIKSHHWKIQPCSAVTGDHLVDGLDWVVNDVSSRLYYSTVQE